MTDRSAPALSVVVASAAGGDFLTRCLESLRDQSQRTGSEVLVVDRCGDSRREEISRRFAFARVLAYPGTEKPNVPQLRAAGFDQSRGPIIAVIEEHCVAADDWIETILATFGPKDSAIGGPMFDDDFRRLRDWVVYFSEYSADIPPWTAGDRGWLNDANAAYGREHLERHRAVLGESYWAAALHPKLVAEGARMKAVPNMVVRHTGPFDYAYYLRQRYLLSRLWGGTQRDRVSLAKRVMHLGAAPIFPAFLLARIAGRVHRSGSARLRARFLRAIPLLLPVLIAYTWGEWLGYLMGPGRAGELVE